MARTGRVQERFVKRHLEASWLAHTGEVAEGNGRGTHLVGTTDGPRFGVYGRVCEQQASGLVLKMVYHYCE